MSARSVADPMEGRLFRVGLCVAALALLAIGYPLATQQVYVDTDLGNLHLPVRHFYAESLAAGEGFDWLPYQHNGHYLHGEGQFGLRHPLNWLSYRLLPLEVAFNLELLRNYVLLLVGTYCLARRWSLRRDASLLAAVLFAFGSFNTLHFMHFNMVFGIAHLPLLLIAIDVLLCSPSPRRAAVAAVSISLLSASQILIGFPQALWLSLVAEGLYVLHLCLHRNPGPRRLAGLIGAQLIAALIGGVQLLPQFEALALSERALRGPDFAFEHSLHPLNLVQLVAPLLFVERALGDEAEGLEYALYAGAALPPLLAWVWIRRSSLDGPARRAVWLLLLGCVLFLLLALGEWGGLYRLQMLIPGVERLRAPARYIALFQLCAAGLAALAFADLATWVAHGRRLPWHRLTPLLAPLGLSVAAAVVAAVIRGARPEAPLAAEIAGPLRIAAGPLLLVASCGCLAACARGHRAALVALLLFALADPLVYGLSFIWRTPPSTVEDWPRRWTVPTAALGHRLHWGPPALGMRHVRLSSGYPSLVPQRSLPTNQYESITAPAPALRAALRVSGIGHAYGRPVPSPLPRVRLVTRAEPVDDLLRQLAATDVDTTALVERPIPLDGPPAQPGRAAITAEQPGLIAIETEAPTRQLLVVAESHHPGWRARLDDAPVAVERVYADFMGVVVPPGRHAVELRFAPESLRRGRALSLLGTALLLPLAWAVSRSGPVVPHA